ncbi:MAG: hypothetical protein KKD28_14895 [Chloroflexi bacterium]|nr:hypothetical protein [Chloroflexota bacterium]
MPASPFFDRRGDLRPVHWVAFDVQFVTGNWDNGGHSFVFPPGYVGSALKKFIIIASFWHIYPVILSLW